MNLRASFFPTRHVEGLLHHVGRIWISQDVPEEDQPSHEVCISLSWQGPWSNNPYYAATIEVMYDGISTLRELEYRGFLDRVEAEKMTSFYEIWALLERCAVPVQVHGEDYFLNRKMFELLDTPS